MNKINKHNICLAQKCADDFDIEEKKPKQNKAKKSNINAAKIRAKL